MRRDLGSLDWRRAAAYAASATAVALTVLGAGVASAGTPAPAWQIRTVSFPTVFSPANGGTVALLATNVGGKATDGSGVTLTDTFPSALTPTSAAVKEPTFTGHSGACVIEGQKVTCKYPAEVLKALNQQPLVAGIKVTVAPGTETAELPNSAEVSGGGAAATATTNEPLRVGTRDPSFGLVDFSTYDAEAAGAQDTQAGDHPSALVTAFDINTLISPNSQLGGAAVGVQDLKDVVVDLPLGVVGNPQATPKCPEYDLTGGVSRCPGDTVIGTIALNLQTAPSLVATGEQFIASNPEIPQPSPIVNVEPEAGYPAQFAFSQAGSSVMMYAKVISTPSGYALRVTAPGISRVIKADGAQLTFFGDPRGQEPFGNQPGTPAAFFTNPVDCTASGFKTTIHVDSWQNPGRFKADGITPDFEGSGSAWQTATASSRPVTGCEKLQFNPTITIRPGTSQTDQPAAFEVDLKVPQNEDPGGLATPEVKSATVTLPTGVAISPPAADGLQGCTAEQLGYDASRNVFSTEPGSCPAASQVGTVEVVTPLLANPLEGRVFVAQPACGGAGQPECTEVAAETGGIFGLYLELQGSGVILKLRGRVEVGGTGPHSPETGLQPSQIRTTFEDTPQQPFSELKLKLNGGPRAPLANPQACGEFNATSRLVPWSTPVTADATPFSPFNIDGDGYGGPCPALLPFSPAFNAGSVTPQAARFTPFTLTFARRDGEQDLSGITVTMPPGLLGKIAGIPKCIESEANAGTCPAASRIGTATSAAGSGSQPLWQSGSAFLTGPYNGGPFGLSVVVPAKAGPFNLGNVVVRAAIHVDPSTSQLTVVSDPLPQSVDGVPLRLKTVNVTIDREGFMFNPTSCEPSRISATLGGANGATAPVTTRFQPTGCAALPFKPTFVPTTGAGGNFHGASLDVRISQKPGEAAIRKVDTQLPLPLPSRLVTLQKACTETQFAANPAGCPPGSAVGVATATTPVLNVPLTGPAYLVSHGGAAFPDLDIVLQGEGVTIDLVGNTDIKRGITFSRFETVPDAPITSFELYLPSGPGALLAATRNLCALKKTVVVTRHLTRRVHGRRRRVTVHIPTSVPEPLLMPTTMIGQNGARITQRAPIVIAGCPSSRIPPKVRHRNRHSRHRKY